MLTDKELMSINGGAIKWGVAMILAAAFSFVVGVFDGYFRPLRCN